MNYLSTQGYFGAHGIGSFAVVQPSSFLARDIPQ
jgi:hypothetical protein